MSAKPKVALTRPTAAKAEAAAIAAQMRGEGETARIVVDVPTDLHRRVKIRAIERGMTIREYVLELLKADGIE